MGSAAGAFGRPLCLGVLVAVSGYTFDAEVSARASFLSFQMSHSYRYPVEGIRSVIAAKASYRNSDEAPYRHSGEGRNPFAFVFRVAGAPRENRPTSP